MPQRTPAPRAAIVAVATWIAIGLISLTLSARPLLAQGQQHGSDGQSDSTQSDTTTTGAAGAGGTMQPMCLEGCGGGGGDPIAKLNITPDGTSTPTRTGYTGPYTATFTALNYGTATGTFSFTCTGSSNVTCSSLSKWSATLAAGASTTVTATYSVKAQGTGTLTVEGEGSAQNSGYYSVPVSAPTYGVAITPAQTTTGTRMGGHGGYADVFKVRNIGQNAGTVTVSCSSVAPVVCQGVSPSSATLAVGDSINVTVSDSVAPVATTATGSVKLMATINTFTATGTTIVPAARYEVVISPVDAAIDAGAGTSGTAAFLVRNLGAVSAWTSFPTCSAIGGLTCGAPPASRTILAGDSAVVDMPFQATGEGSGTLSLSARENESYDTATVAVTAVAYAVAVTPGFDSLPYNPVADTLNLQYVPFTVRNASDGGASQTVDLACHAEYGAECAGSLPSLTLGAGDSAVVNVGFRWIPFSISVGHISLTATLGAPGQPEDTGTWAFSFVNPEPARPSIIAVTGYEDSHPFPPESGPYPFVVTVENQGGDSAYFAPRCSGTSNQVNCPTPNPRLLRSGEKSDFAMEFNVLGLGTFPQELVVDATPVLDTGVVAPSDSQPLGTIKVEGASIITSLVPIDSGLVQGSDSLIAVLSPAERIDTVRTHMYIDGNSFAGRVVTPTRLSASVDAIISQFDLPPGWHTWSAVACVNDGARCDAIAVPFQSMTDKWALDDNLPPPDPGEGMIAGLLGALVPPAESLLGCPQQPGDPEIRLVEPTSYLSQPSPGGLVFAASVAGADTASWMRFATATVDHQSDDPITCSDFNYLPATSFNWDFWIGTSRHDNVYSVYPYSDKDSLFALFDGHSPHDLFEMGAFELAMANAPGPRVSEPRLHLKFPVHRSLELTVAPARSSAVARASSRSHFFLPDPGAINTASFRLTLNDVAIVDTGVVVDSTLVKLTALRRYGASLLVSPLLMHRYHFADSTSDNGGWNELVATISDSSGNTTSVRTRFVAFEPGPPAPLALTALRDFSRLDQGECAAFGAFQCGGVMLTQTIPGFVSRDRARDLHLVYRSASQRSRAILPIKVYIARYQKAPDSITTQALVNGTAAGPLLRYAGLQGTVSGNNATNLWEDANETREVAAELTPSAQGDLDYRQVKVAVTSYYSDRSHIADTLTQDVLSPYLTSRSATRFGRGWQLAELQRMILTLTPSGDTVAVLLSGDGSYAAYHKAGSGFVAPPGETARLVDSTATTGLGARYVLFLANGACVGFNSYGWQVWTADLLGNRTTFAYDPADPGRLTSISDPAGKKFLFRYNTAGRAERVVVQRSTSASDTVVVANLAYSGTGDSTDLAAILVPRDGAHTDTTRFAYELVDSVGALLDSLITPDSAHGGRHVTRFTYDPLLHTPLMMTGPDDRYGATIAHYRSWLRRATPRQGYGRPGTGALERMLYVSQARGSFVPPDGHVTDYATDAFSRPTMVRRVSDGSTEGGFLITSAAADQLRHIERDSAGQVTKIVIAREIPAVADSVLYRYDALGRVDTIIRPTAAWPVPTGAGAAVMDTITFAYDSVTLSSQGAWCSRLLSSTDVAHQTTHIVYGTSGASRCLPFKAIGLAEDTTTFTYGSLTAGVASGVRPVTIRDPNGLTQTVTYDAATWNTATLVRGGDGATSHSYYDELGRADSVVAPDGTVTRFIRDRLGRAVYQKTGTGPLAPTVHTLYDEAGRAALTEVYASTDGDLTTPLDTLVQRTLHYYSATGQLDSVVGPGSRTASGVRARKQSYWPTRMGVPLREYPGNGTSITRTANWLGAVKQMWTSPVGPGIWSPDGERFADGTTAAKYTGWYPLAGGANLSAGQFYQYTYDNKGEVLSEEISDTYLGALATHAWTYSPRGALVAAGTNFADGIGASRQLEYNRRGQRTTVSDGVSAGGAQVAGDAESVLHYTYDATTGRLADLLGTGAGGDTVATVHWSYDRGGRETQRKVTLPGGSAPYITSTAYDAEGRLASITTTMGGTTYYSYSATSFDAADRVTAASETVRRGQTAAHTVTQYTYDSTGTGRLLSVHATTDGIPRTEAWTYDVFGNRASTYTTADACGIVPLRYGPDNRLVARDSTPSCAGEHYWTDQAGRRLGSTITGYTAPPADSGLRTTLSYTAGGQLYYAVTPTDDIGHWDYTWHWYDGSGRRLMSQLVPYHQGRDVLDPKTVTSGRRDYYVYDGDELTLTLSHGADGGWRVAQRILSAGIDGALAGRYWTPDAGSPQSLFVLRDRQGTTLGAYRADGTPDPQSWYQALGAFGAPAGDGGTGSQGKSSATATGFTGAGAPSASGGYVYLRNRWYDPQTGRFLTQDPIGLAGGVNLYAYAGNDPVNFSDPFGLCPPCTRGERAAAIFAGVGQLLKPWQKPLEVAGVIATAPLTIAGDASGVVTLGLSEASEGVAPVASVAETGVQANRAQGQAGERLVKRMLERAGANVVGSQVGVRTSQGLRVIDHLAQATDGSYVAVEVKTGNAVRTAAQLAKDLEIEFEGGTVVGKNAPAALRGQVVKMPTVEVRP